MKPEPDTSNTMEIYELISVFLVDDLRTGLSSNLVVESNIKLYSFLT